MNNNKQLTKISEYETLLESIDNFHDARRFLSLAQGFVTAARKEYIASERANEVKDDRDRSYDTAVKAGELRLMAEAKLGELLKLGKKNGELLKPAQTKSSHPDTTRLADIGITKQESFSAQQIAEHKDLIPEVVATAIKNRDIPTRKQMEALISGKAHVSYGTGENEWYTPKEYIELAVKVMGHIDLDPASTKEVNVIIKAGKYYDKESDGLKQDWFGNIWVNPPYAQPLVDKFATKLVEEYKRKHVNQAIVLVNNATETKWFQGICSVASAICFPLGRVKFWSPNNEISAPLQGQAVIYIGDNNVSFCEEFVKIGLVVAVIHAK